MRAFTTIHSFSTHHTNTKFFTQTIFLAFMLLCLLKFADTSYGNDALGGVGLIAPSGEITEASPQFEWEKAVGATWYQLWIGVSNEKVFSKWYEAADVISADKGSVTPNVSLVEDNYTWYVRTYGENGNGAWSQGMAFSVALEDVGPPDAAVLVSPSGDVVNPITFSWNVVADSTWYKLHVNDSNNQAVIKDWYKAEDTNCGSSSGNCSVALDNDTFPSGDYSWWIKTWNQSGEGVWSESLSFSVGAETDQSTPPSATTLISPEGAVSEAESFTWNAVPSSTWYYLQVNNATGPQIETWYEAKQAGCESGTGTCSITLESSVELSSGECTWWVKTWSENGRGPWSLGMKFSIDSNVTPPIKKSIFSTYGGGGNDYGRSIQQTEDGGYIVAGDTNSFGVGNSDAWILKLNSSGGVEWQKTYGGDNYDYGKSIQQTEDGGYIVAGDTSSFGAGNSDAWILKLNSTGEVEWQKTYGGGGNDSGLSIQQTKDGGYVVAGITYSFGASNSDAWILKLNSSGGVEWQKTYGGDGYDIGESIQQTSGGYIVAGETKSNGAGLFDVWVFTMDSFGNKIDEEACGVLSISDTNTSPSSTEALIEDSPITPENTEVVAGKTIVIPYNTEIEPKSACVTTWYLDADGDGYGDPDIFKESNSQPDGYVVLGTDCNDDDASVHPDAEEIYEDGIDQDCNGTDIILMSKARTP